MFVINSGIFNILPEKRGGQPQRQHPDWAVQDVITGETDGHMGYLCCLTTACESPSRISYSENKPCKHFKGMRGSHRLITAVC